MPQKIVVIKPFYTTCSTWPNWQGSTRDESGSSHFWKPAAGVSEYDNLAQKSKTIQILKPMTPDEPNLRRMAPDESSFSPDDPRWFPLSQNLSPMTPDEPDSNADDHRWAKYEAFDPRWAKSYLRWLPLNQIIAPMTPRWAKFLHWWPPMSQIWGLSPLPNFSPDDPTHKGVYRTLKTLKTLKA